MYKRVLVFLLVTIWSANYAQSQMTFGVRTGFNLTNLSVQDDDGNKPDKNPKFTPGFQIGMVVDYALSDVLSIQPGILFATQGAKVGWDDGIDSKVIMSLNYIQVPINMQYKLDLGEINLLLQAGPYLGYGISGKFKIWDETGKRISDNDLKDWMDDEDWFKIKFGSDKDKHNAKALDFGIGLGVGLQFNNLQAGLGYNLGLMNISHQLDSNDKSSLKNNGLVVTLTYLFGN